MIKRVITKLIKIIKTTDEFQSLLLRLLITNNYEIRIVNNKIFTRINKNLKSKWDRSFTATKSKETRNKILAQENAKDSGMR